MGLFSGPRERRYNGFTAQFVSPPIPPNSAAGAVTASFNAGRVESSLQKVAIWSSVVTIARLATELPIEVFADFGDQSRPVKAPGYFADAAGDGYGTEDWVFAALVSFMLRGNLNGKVVERDRRGGFPTQVPLYHPDEVHGWRDRDGIVQWRAGGARIDPEDMFHRRAFVMPGRLMGLSAISFCAQTIGVGLAAQQFGADFFANGANTTGVLRNTKVDTLSAEVAQSAKEKFVAAMNRRREPVTIGAAWEWQPLAVKPDESQFLETQKYTAAECARIFGPGMPEILGYDTGTGMTYQNVEQRNMHLLVYTLDPWWRLAERALSAMLPRPRVARFDRRELLRTDLLTRLKAHATGIAARIIVPSEARADEGYEPMTDEQKAELAALQVAPPTLKAISVTPPTK